MRITTNMAMSSPIEAPTNELMSALSTLLEQGKYSDLTIKCGRRRFAVHRAIICSRSGFFDGAISHPFRESMTGEIDLSEDDEEAVEHMVNYFYHLDYLQKRRSHRTSRSSSVASLYPASPVQRRPKKLNLALVEDPLLAMAATNSMSVPNPYTAPPNPNPYASPTSPTSYSRSPSDLFGASPINMKLPPQSPLQESFHEEMFDLPPPEQEPDVEQPYLLTHAKVYALAEKYGVTGLKALARKKFASQVSIHYTSLEFAEAMQEVYDSTIESDRGLRDIVIHAFRTHPEIARRNDIQAVVKETPLLAWELFRVAWGMPVNS